MKTYLILALDEQNNEWSVEIDAPTMREAQGEFANQYPESILVNISRSES